MLQAYEWADVVICRAGALTVTELMAVGVASILIPLPHAIDDHQTQNALQLADVGAAILLPQSDLTADKLIKVLLELSSDPARLRQYGEKARCSYRSGAVEAIVNDCSRLLNDA
jgi:UDP-N-acetylglucosamine--N-acetylmuramyl-(pentapeptide) pyrophosphoryl-undecaprenol N-acetylglucosamine transferase